MSKSFFVSIFAASALTVGLGFLFLAASFSVQTTDLAEGVLGAIAVIIPTGAAAWWLFQKRLAHASPRLEALVVALVFGVSAPLATILSIPLAQIPGGHLAVFGRIFGLIGSVAAVIVGVTLFCFATTSLASWAVRRLFGDS
jgi:hypothetical protein